ncbi:N-acetylgalactosamine kinase [Drosophila pseudoobscura]|uniref:N-acetylgalactosamine kinase n=1 Tax=Drosophila pseudoobscura pseudoobscura TaxID=46245 RepID=A0A6I8VJY8_DROPS|nr:N-acetylgalactosamine kinase [Drosophila pseudoobscura]XP_015042529.2 N-acetylgalactosamine kinase [Drosophila pseudoobscura]XP_033240432.1 N-acetylgalactosamine kinase [Drosophila pseudoobscura]XP_033240433.1 N-acetylgalactosamine kinase [Drosophila pseudoobscura]
MTANGNGTGDILGPGIEIVAQQKLQPDAKMYGRMQRLGAFFKEQFGAEPDFFVRVPGRVNIIGEHVDYCGYSVLPMAVTQSIVLAVGSNPTELHQLQLRNLDQANFQNFQCDLKSLSVELPLPGGPAWYKYFMCGVRGIEEHLGRKKFSPIGMRIAVDGNVPLAAGLSSSSAMVSSAVLATAHVQGMKLDRKELASISAKCEQYIGTHSGGMDQAIAYLGREGCAHHIEFHPQLNGTPVILPAGKCFVVANSLAQKNKAASSDYNERVVECRLATRWLARHKNLSNWQEIIRFIDLEEACGMNNETFESFIKEKLTKWVYTRADICQEWGIKEQELEAKYLTANTQHMQQFKLRQRALHVIQESGRVVKFRKICEQLALHASEEDIKQLGLLMRQSHESLRELYECSHPDVERLIAISEKQNVSARVTGAGWGGCIVAMCDSQEDAAKYINALKRDYYAQLPPHLLERHQPNDFNEVVFATFPGNGAELFVP